MLPATDSERFQQHAESILNEIVSPRRFNHWFRGKTSIVCQHGDTLVVSVGNPYLANWIQREFRQELAETARRVIGPHAQCRIDVDVSVSDRTAANEESPLRQRSATRTTSPAGAPQGQRKRQYADLDRFVIGRCNELAATAARQVAGAPGAVYSPLYVYGGVGNGKTHLLEGVYRRIRREYPALQTVLLTAESFGNYFTQALSEKSLPSFRQRFRNVDVLLVDDADFFDGKRAIQEEFLNTLKKLEREERQVVVTADRHPRLLTKSSDDLVSRLLSGLVCRIETPDDETRLAIVRRQAVEMQLAVDDDVLRLVADRFTNNVRELNGALNCVKTYASLTGRRVTYTAARTAIANLERDCLRIVRIADVERAVCRLFGVSTDDLKSATRARSVAQPRMLAMYLTRRLTNSPYSEIGRYFGGRNHATVMSAEKKIAKLVDSAAQIRVSTESWPVLDVVRALEQQVLAG